MDKIEEREDLNELRWDVFWILFALGSVIIIISMVFLCGPLSFFFDKNYQVKSDINLTEALFYAAILIFLIILAIYLFCKAYKIQIQIEELREKILGSTVYEELIYLERNDSFGRICRFIKSLFN